MHLIAIGWLYVALMAAVVEAASPQGTVLGAVFTFVGYGVLPLAIVLYISGSRSRRAVRRMADANAGPHALAADSVAQEAAFDSTRAAAPDPMRPASISVPGLDPDRGHHAPGHAIAPERVEP